MAILIQISDEEHAKTVESVSRMLKRTVHDQREINFIVARFDKLHRQGRDPDYSTILGRLGMNE